MHPDSAGEPVGCVSTTFTFDPVFYEEECLSRFLNMETDADSSGALYLIEREEQLSGLKCASVLVDQNYCRINTRNLRWDMLSARFQKRVLHSKVTILQWHRFIRVIVASANLTENGYRTNQEIFGVLDYYPDCSLPLNVLRGIIEYLKTIVKYSSDKRSSNPAILRWNNFLNGIEETVSKWNLDEDYNNWNKPRIYPVMAGKDDKSVFEQIKELWPAHTPPKTCYVVSPFFDVDNERNLPAENIWNILNRRGKAKVIYNVTFEETGEENELLLHAPETLNRKYPENRENTEVEFRILNETIEEHIRPVHFKCIMLENRNWLGYLIGSSNFTTPGLGLTKYPNLELNLFYLIKKSSINKGLYKYFRNSIIIGRKLEKDYRFQWEPREDETIEDEDMVIILHGFFQDALYNKGFVELKFSDKHESPEKWKIIHDDSVILDKREWEIKGKPDNMKIDWTGKPPSGFEVLWKEMEKSAWWPLNILDSGVLPTPEELKNLPLEVLIDVLSSSRPLKAYKRILMYRKSLKEENIKYQPIIDPHKKVDTSSFLLRRMRKLSWAMEVMRKKLERPALTEDIVSWRLYGPLGVNALAEAIRKEFKDSEEEKCFLLAELALELSRVEPFEDKECLSKEIINQKIGEYISDIKREIEEEDFEENKPMSKYIKNIFERI